MNWQAWVLAGILVTNTASIAWSQSGITLSGVEEGEELRYRFDFGGVRGRRERYRLEIPAQNVAVSELQLNFESSFDGSVDPEKARLEVEGQVVPLGEIFWDDSIKSLEVQIAEPVAAGQNMELILSEVRNPRNGGFYRVQARLLGTEPNPIFRYIGIWILDIVHSVDVN